MPTRLLMPLLALLLVAAAPPQLNDPETAEGWIWQLVQAGAVADLTEWCGTIEPVDIHTREDTRWQEPCRRVDPVLLRTLLTQPDLADHAPHGVRIVGARIDGDLDLSDAHVRAAEVWLEGSWIAGDVVLANARLDGLLSLDGTRIDGRLIGSGIIVGSDLTMQRADFGGPVSLLSANVEGQMAMDGASVAEKQTFVADGLHVGAGGLFLRQVKFGGPVLLRAAHVEGQMAMDGASVADQQTFDAEGLHVGAGGLALDQVKFGGPVDLLDAHVEGQMSMVDASVADQQTFDAERLHVGSDLLARSVTFGGDADFRALAVDGVLDLRDSHARQLDLTGASIRDDLLLGGRFDDGSEHWVRWDACDSLAPCVSLRNARDSLAPSLNLRNARVGNFQDDERAWSDYVTLTLEGFTYTHLGGFGGEARQDMRNRPIDWWRDWLQRDPVYSAQPYAHLAGVLAAAGNRDGAADIRFFGRDRERTELLRGCTWLQKLGLVEKPDDDRSCRWGAGLALSAQQAFVGYGIGTYGFRALYYALAPLVLAGTVILLFAPGVHGVRSTRRGPRGPWQKSPLWCIGAALHQVLPVISLSKEFSDFFDDPRRERLRSWQHVAFAVLTLLGWALAGFVAAAFTGLIQS